MSSRGDVIWAALFGASAVAMTGELASLWGMRFDFHAWTMAMLTTQTIVFGVMAFLSTLRNER